MFFLEGHEGGKNQNDSVWLVGGKCLSWYLLDPGPDLPESFTVGASEPLRSESSLLPPLLGSAQFLFLPPEL